MTWKGEVKTPEQNQTNKYENPKSNKADDNNYADDEEEDAEDQEKEREDENPDLNPIVKSSTRIPLGSELDVRYLDLAGGRPDRLSLVSPEPSNDLNIIINFLSTYLRKPVERSAEATGAEPKEIYERSTRVGQEKEMDATAVDLPNLDLNPIVKSSTRILLGSELAVRRLNITRGRPDRPQSVSPEPSTDNNIIMTNSLFTSMMTIAGMEPLKSPANYKAAKSQRLRVKLWGAETGRLSGLRAQMTFIWSVPGRVSITHTDHSATGHTGPAAAEKPGIAPSPPAPPRQLQRIRFKTRSSQPVHTALDSSSSTSTNFGSITTNLSSITTNLVTQLVKWVVMPFFEINKKGTGKMVAKAKKEIATLYTEHSYSREVLGTSSANNPNNAGASNNVPGGTNRRNRGEVVFPKDEQAEGDQPEKEVEVVADLLQLPEVIMVSEEHHEETAEQHGAEESAASENTIWLYGVNVLADNPEENDGPGGEEKKKKLTKRPDTEAEAEEGAEEEKELGQKKKRPRETNNEAPTSAEGGQGLSPGKDQDSPRGDSRERTPLQEWDVNRLHKKANHNSKPTPDEKIKTKDENKELVGEKEKPSRAKRDMKK